MKPHIVLTGNPPSVNHLYGHVGNRRYMTAAGKALKEDWQWQAKSQMKGAPMTGRLFASIRFYFPDARKRDLDNALKVTQDCLTGIAFADDSQIDMLLMSRNIDRQRPRVEITLMSAELPSSLVFQASAENPHA